MRVSAMGAAVERTPLSLGRSALVSVAGPVAHALWASVGLVALAAAGPSSLAKAAALGCWMSLLEACANMVPVQRTDGGRLLAALRGLRATPR